MERFAFLTCYPLGINKRVGNLAITRALVIEGNCPKDERAAIMVEANFDLRFEFSNLNYPGTYVHDVSNSHLGGL